MITTVRGILVGLVSLLAVLAFASAAAAQAPQTTTERIKGTPVVTTEQEHATVLSADGNLLLVQKSTGVIQAFRVPDSTRFTIDGKEVSVHELKPGVKLTATVTTTTTPVTERTTTIGSGTVFFVTGNTVVVTTDGENKIYTVKDSYRFVVDGEKTSVHGLRKGMRISAEKIVESPHTEISSNTVVTGQLK
jgi:RNase P/RNase MRP subunit p29